MASEISSISHLGVEVAPQTPMELAPANRELSISSALSIKCELALTFLHSLNSILPLELFLPLTKNIKSWEAANFRILGIRFATCRQIVSYYSKVTSGEMCPSMYFTMF